ncbi:MAG TPA: homocysteine S-methyltransferase family protein [Candidatus Marinimicrobia bacterium]|jgi:5-methyltetrahydrofolate--homocysteine methyltransferase|nr:homocysteine S-methyltransferase family protein [Candidatus Neomarinimicrobiota bacterium]
MPYNIIKENLSTKKPVLLDGGIGTEVLRRGVRWLQHGIEDAPHVIRDIHVDYLNAGVDVLTTHTFNLTKRNFINFFRDADHMDLIGAPGLPTRAMELCRAAVSLAKEALTQTGKAETVPLAGSISPVMHLFRPDLSPPENDCLIHHKECIEILSDCGVDLIFFEGMNNTREAQAALQAAAGFDLPVWMSFVPGVDGNLLNGELLLDAANLARSQGAEAVLVSAGSIPMITNSLSNIINGSPCGAKAIIGRYSPPSWKPDFYPRFEDTDEVSPEKYAQEVNSWLDQGVHIVGGSSGTTPEHIRAVRKMIG